MNQAIRKNAEMPDLAPWRARGLREAGAILLLAIAGYVLLALVSFDSSDPSWSHSGRQITEGALVVGNSAGPVGAHLADMLFNLIGYLAYLTPFMVAYAAFLVYRGRQKAEGELSLEPDTAADAAKFDEELLGQAPMPIRLVGFVLTLIAGSSLATLHQDVPLHLMPSGAGGIFGAVFGGATAQWFDFMGATLLLLALFLVGITLFTSLSWLGLIDRLGHYTLVYSAKGQERFLLWRDQRRDRLAAAAKFGVQPKNPLRVFVSNVIYRLRTLLPSAEPIYSAPRDSAPDLGDFADVADGSQTAARTPSADVPEDLSIVEDAGPTVSTPAEPAVSVVERVVEKVAEKVAEPKKVLLRMPKKKAVPANTARNPRPEGLPSLDLLEPPPPLKYQYSPAALQTMSDLVEKVLSDFNIKATVEAVSPGPVVTRFELELAPGVKVSQVTNLAKDLARGLSTSSVRVVEIITGKSFIGLEVPNSNREMVSLSDVVGSKAFAESKSPLTLALGHDIGGAPVVADLAKMPHLLVAGTTGSGKSVGINSMLISMLLKSNPEEVRMILIDPKMLELSVYEGIPHLLAPVVTDMKEASNALRWCVAEMERRYKLMSMLGVRNLAGCNKKLNDAIAAGQPITDPMFKAEADWEGNMPSAPELEPMPQIVVVIDELADMMMVVGKKVEELIARLAQKARAAGIHLILATQRPSVDVITGLIKANIPTRMAFQVSSKIDSRTILDQMGAESLLGHGDMLYQPPGSSYPVRVHGAFVDDHEVHAIADDWRERGEADYIEDVLSGPSDGSGLLPGEKPEPAEGAEAVDELFDQAVAIVTDTRKASISYIQRRLSIGYNRSARLVEQMEEMGIVSPMGNNGQRQVLAGPAPSD